jgi:hypothetical protein
MANELSWAQAHFSIYNPEYDRFHDYYRGNHRKVTTTTHLTTMFGQLFNDLRINECPIVVDALADRLQIASITSDNTTASKFIDEVWTKNKMDGGAGIVHSQAVKLGDAYVSVGIDPITNQIIINPEKRNSVAVRYGYDGFRDVIVEAVKVWDEGGRLRINRYLQDRTERYITLNPTTEIPSDISKLTPYEADGKPAVIPNPVGIVPVFHFSNAQEPDEFATSSLADVIPLQDQLNQSIGYLLIAQEFGAIKQKYAIGLDMPVNPETGEPYPLKTEPGSIWFFGAGDGNVELGEFSTADLEPILKVQEAFELKIARVSQVPAHLFMLQSSNFPSGESLKTAEAPLNSKVRDRQIAWGNVWENICSFACKLKEIDPGTIECNWHNTNSRSEKEDSEIADNLVRAGFPLSFVARKVYGLTDDEIQKLLDEKAEETEAQGRLFDSGEI